MYSIEKELKDIKTKPEDIQKVKNLLAEFEDEINGENYLCPDVSSLLLQINSDPLITRFEYISKDNGFFKKERNLTNELDEYPNIKIILIPHLSKFGEWNKLGHTYKSFIYDEWKESEFGKKFINKCGGGC